MIYQIYKKHFLIFSKIFLYGFVVLALSTGIGAYAQYDCSGFSDKIANDQQLFPTDILCPIIRVINFLMLVVGFVFLVLVVYGAIKLSLSLGDVKGFAAAWSTWQYALIGAGVVVGVFAIIIILASAFGINLNPLDVFDELNQQILDLMNTFEIRPE